jgi:hypothetical protein
MAKSDSFFIRAIVESNGTTYAQNEIDLGSFVNLGVSKSTLLRIHNISCQISDVDGVADSISAASACKIAHQLTTQNQILSGLVTANNKSLICSGSMQLYNAQTAEDGSAAADFSTGFATHDFDVAPQQFTQGYLVGVDALFIGVDQSAVLTSGNVKVCYVMECTLEAATQANSVALALSQQ